MKITATPLINTEYFTGNKFHVSVVTIKYMKLPG